MSKILLTAMLARDKFIILRAAEMSGFKETISVEDAGDGYINVYTVSNENHSPFWNKVEEIRRRSITNRAVLKFLGRI